jgi:F0F1-type ATP synthase epsilon subunit
MHQAKVSQVTFPSFNGYVGFSSQEEGSNLTWKEFDSVAKIEAGVITAKIIGDDGIEKNQMFMVNGGFAFFYEDECSLTVPEIRPIFPEETGIPGSPSIPARGEALLSVL